MRALCQLARRRAARINRWTYGIDADAMQAASGLNESLQELNGTVLFIPTASASGTANSSKSTSTATFTSGNMKRLVQTWGPRWTTV